MLNPSPIADFLVAERRRQLELDARTWRLARRARRGRLRGWGRTRVR
jgi:hypothetical protein